MMEIVTPITWPKGPVQHLMVMGMVTVNPREPKVVKAAESSWLKMLRFWESTPWCS